MIKTEPMCFNKGCGRVPGCTQWGPVSPHLRDGQLREHMQHGQRSHRECDVIWPRHDRQIVWNKDFTFVLYCLALSP